MKSSFTGRRDQIRLINTLGDSAARWTAPTIFIIAERGIGYADPGLLPNATRAARDAVILPVIARRHVSSLVLGAFFLTRRRAASAANLLNVWGTAGGFARGGRAL